MKKILAIVLMMILVLAPMAIAEDFNPADYPVAVCMSNLTHPVHRIVQLGFLKTAEELGYTNAKPIGTEGSDAAEVFQALEAFADEGGKGVCLFWGDDGCYEAVEYAAEAGVVVGIPHFKHEQEDGTYPTGLAFNMACDPVLYGQQVAELMASKLTGKTGSVALTQNTMNVTENAATDSFRTTWESLKGTYELDGIKLLDTVLEGAVVDEATAINLSIIQANSDILGAFGTTGNSPITWSGAAEKAGYADGELVLVGMDATEGNLDALEAGKVTALVAQPLYEEAQKTMEYLDTIFRGGEVPMWTDLVAPVVTVDGEGQNGPAFHRDIAAQVAEFFA